MKHLLRKEQWRVFINDILWILISMSLFAQLIPLLWNSVITEELGLAKEISKLGAAKLYLLIRLLTGALTKYKAIVRIK